jgi:hypothetical protein
MYAYPGYFNVAMDDRFWLFVVAPTWPIPGFSPIGLMLGCHFVLGPCSQSVVNVVLTLNYMYVIIVVVIDLECYNEST